NIRRHRVTHLHATLNIVPRGVYGIHLRFEAVFNRKEPSHANERHRKEANDRYFGFFLRSVIHGPSLH
ncbi:MAG: hypothetical protein ACI9BD_001547, partial [Candidatus Marinamargulisbacteria bacterium]